LQLYCFRIIRRDRETDLPRSVEIRR